MSRYVGLDWTITQVLQIMWDLGADTTDILPIPSTHMGAEQINT